MKKTIAIFLTCALVMSLCFALAVSAQKDLAESISLPAALIKGHSYQFPVPGEGVTITVNGQAHTEAYVADGTSAQIVYTDAQGEQLAEYTLPVLDSQNSSDHSVYFYDPTGTIQVVENENNVVLQTKKDGSIHFANKLNSENFALNFNLSQDEIPFQYLTITLTDATDARNTVTMRLDTEVGYLKVSGQSHKLDLESTVQLRYKNSLRAVYVGDVKLTGVAQNDENEAFAGFTNGVYLTIGFQGVTADSQLTMTRICNQTLGHKGHKTADIGEPAVVITSQMISKQFMGETFEIPSYAVFDVYSPVVESSVEVEMPDGTKTNQNFTVEQYGRYKITFTAKDAHGNKAKVTKSVFVNNDIAPTLQVNALEKTEYKLGDTVSYPAYTASDDLGMCYVDVMVILPNGETRLLLHDDCGQITYTLTDAVLYGDGFRYSETAFKTEKTGTYTLRYVAYDDQFNKVVYETTFLVK